MQRKTTLQELASYNPIVFGVCPDPEPTDAVGHFHAQGVVTVGSVRVGLRCKATIAP